MRLEEMERQFTADSTGAILTLRPEGVIDLNPKTAKLQTKAFLLFNGMRLEFSTTSTVLTSFGPGTFTSQGREDDLTAAELEEDLNDLLDTKRRYEALGSDGFIRYSDYRANRSRSR